MVARKYLCSSPHPDTWDERAAALLKSLGGSKARRRRILRETLSRLDTETLVRKDLKPGRKTHAEHAIAFYRHVLNLNEEDAAAASDQVDEEKGGAGGGEIKSRKRHANKRKRDVSKTEDDSVLSMDSEEFLSQHNDLCEVCNGAGELICCSTCNLVFHLKCIRPPTTRLPPDHWSCAYCVSAGIRGHVKEARTRRRAAAAAREMTRLKHELNTQGTSDSEDADGKPKTREKKRRGSETQPPETAGETAQEDDVEDGKLKAKRQKVDDDCSAAEEDVEGIEGRPRRPRRQPTLYDPQAGAASRWQSDGVTTWKTMGHEKDASVDGHNNESSDDEEGSDEQIWCTFCEDDPSIAVCCFCACRVCFGKHDSSQLLLCDECDDEYHTFCLDPPLTSVPNSKKWFCPSCDPSNKKEVKESPALSPKKSKRSPRKSGPVPESTPPVKTGPGRSRKSVIAGASSSANSVDSQQPVKRGPGRPRKNPGADTPNSAKSVKSTPSKRGRPKKNPVGQTDAQKPALKSSGSQKDDESGVVKRSRGRPRKIDQSPQTDAKKTPTQRNDSASKASTRPGAKDGMPLVTPASAAESFDKVASLAVSGTQMSTDASKTPLSLQKSRSGRTVKRGTFHDEIDEGVQHLKTVRLTMEPPQKRGSLEIQGTADSTLQGQKPSTEIGGQEPRASPITSTQTLDEEPPAKVSVPSSLDQSQNTPATAASAATISLSTPMVSSLHPAGALDTPTFTQVSTSVSQVPSTDPAPQQDARSTKVPRRKPGARECMQISRRFGVKVIPQKYVETLEDYCTRGKVEHLIRMRERLDDHSRMLEAQLAGLEALIKEKGETDITVPAAESTGDTQTP